MMGSGMGMIEPLLELRQNEELCSEHTLSHGYCDAFYKKAQKVRTLIINDFKNVFKEVDFVIGTPTLIPRLNWGISQYPFFGELMDSLMNRRRWPEFLQ